MRRKRAAAAILLLASTLFTPGCIGSFALSRDVWTHNSKIDNGVGRELLFLGLILVPVYPIALLADLLVFNTVELFSGENIYATPQTRSKPSDDTVDAEP